MQYICDVLGDLVQSDVVGGAFAKGTHWAQLPSGLLTHIVPISQSSNDWRCQQIQQMLFKAKQGTHCIHQWRATTNCNSQNDNNPFKERQDVACVREKTAFVHNLRLRTCGTCTYFKLRVLVPFALDWITLHLCCCYGSKSHLPVPVAAFLLEGLFV